MIADSRVFHHTRALCSFGSKISNRLRNGNRKVFPVRHEIRIRMEHISNRVDRDEAELGLIVRSTTVMGFRGVGSEPDGQRTQQMIQNHVACSFDGYSERVIEKGTSQCMICMHSGACFVHRIRKFSQGEAPESCIVTPVIVKCIE